MRFISSLSFAYISCSVIISASCFGNVALSIFVYLKSVRRRVCSLLVYVRFIPRRQGPGLFLIEHSGFRLACGILPISARFSFKMKPNWFCNFFPNGILLPWSHFLLRWQRRTPFFLETSLGASALDGTLLVALSNQPGRSIAISCLPKLSLVSDALTWSSKLSSMKAGMCLAHSTRMSSCCFMESPMSMMEASCLPEISYSLSSL